MTQPASLRPELGMRRRRDGRAGPVCGSPWSRAALCQLAWECRGEGSNPGPDSSQEEGNRPEKYLHMQDLGQWSEGSDFSQGHPGPTQCWEPPGTTFAIGQSTLDQMEVTPPKGPVQFNNCSF